MTTIPPREPWADRHVWQIRPMRDLLLVGAAALLLWAALQVRGIFAPVLIGLALAYLLNPLVDRAERRTRLSRSWVLSLILILLGLIGVGLGLWLVPLMIDQTTTLIAKTPDYLRSLTNHLDRRFNTGQMNLQEVIDNLPKQRLASGTSWLFGFVGDVIGVATYSAMIVVLVPIYFFVFALHFHAMQEWFKQFIPRSRLPRTLEIVGKMDTAVATFFRGRLIVAVIMAALFAIGWCPLLADVPYWLVLAIFTGLLSLIPYAAGLGWLLAVALKALEQVGQSGGGGSAWEWGVAIGAPTLVYTLVQIFEGWLLTPWLQGKSLGLSAATVLLAVLIGGAAGGLVGLLIAIPLTACLKILLDEVISPALRAWAKTH